VTRPSIVLFAVAALALAAGPVAAQTETAEPAGESAPAAAFDTSYRPSMVVSARLQRQFLDAIRWSAGVEARDRLAATFAERSPVEIWQELVAPDGLQPNNVADALAAYWVLNWVIANAAYDVEVDSGPVRAQVSLAMANDANFRTMGDQQKQELAEGYILNFLLEHAALNDAVARKDEAALSRLATAAVTRFRRQMGVDLLSLVPGPEGLVPKAR